MPTGLLAVVAIALLGAAAVAFAYRAEPRRALFWTVLPLLLIAGLAAAWWAWPVGPVTAGFVWLPVVTGGLTIAFLMLAISASDPAPEPAREPLRGARRATSLYIGFLVTVLGITLVATFV